LTFGKQATQRKTLRGFSSGDVERIETASGCCVFLMLEGLSYRCTDTDPLRILAEPLLVATVCVDDECRRSRCSFLSSTHLLSMFGALSWRGQIAVNCPRMMQNAGLNRGHAASNLLFCRLSAAEMHRVAKRTEYSSAF
jgi:hypothetical protein